MQIKLHKVHRAALIKASGVDITDDYLRKCLAGHASVNIETARLLVKTWAEIRLKIADIYDVPAICIKNLISHKEAATK